MLVPTGPCADRENHLRAKTQPNGARCHRALLRSGGRPDLLAASRGASDEALRGLRAELENLPVADAVPPLGEGELRPYLFQAEADRTVFIGVQPLGPKRQQVRDMLLLCHSVAFDVEMQARAREHALLPGAYALSRNEDWQRFEADLGAMTVSQESFEQSDRRVCWGSRRRCHEVAPRTARDRPRYVTGALRSFGLGVVGAISASATVGGAPDKALISGAVSAGGDALLKWRADTLKTEKVESMVDRLFAVTAGRTADPSTSNGDFRRD